MPVPLVDFRAQYQGIRDELAMMVEQVLEANDPSANVSTRAFEAEFAAYCRARYAVGVASGTDALSLALRACGIGPRDEVITVANGSQRTVGAILSLQAVPVFVDVHPATHTLDPGCLPAAIGPRTRAIVPVHVYGQMADMDAIVSFASHHGLVVVEEASQAPGASDRAGRAGSVGDAAAFSFDAASNLGAYGEAGAVTTNSRAIADVVRALRDHGAADSAETYSAGHPPGGIGSRLSELQAAVLRVKLRYLDGWNRRRLAHARAYRHLLKDVNVVLPEVRTGTRHVFHRYVIEVGERDLIRSALNDRGIATSVPCAVPLHQRPAYVQDSRIVDDLKVTVSLSRTGLSIPMYPELLPRQIAYVTACLREHVAVVRAGSRPN